MTHAANVSVLEAISPSQAGAPGKQHAAGSSEMRSSWKPERPFPAAGRLLQTRTLPAPRKRRPQSPGSRKPRSRGPCAARPEARRVRRRRVRRQLHPREGRSGASGAPPGRAQALPGPTRTATPPSPRTPASPPDSALRGSPGLTHLALVAPFPFFAEVHRRQAGQVESGAPTRARPQQEQPQQQP